MLGKALTTAAGNGIATSPPAQTYVQTNPGSNYSIDRSVRFDNAWQSYFDRTPSSTGNQRTWTLSFWIKPSLWPTSASYWYKVFNAGFYDSGNATIIDVTGGLRLAFFSGGSYAGYYFISQGFHDLQNWYHVVIAVDTNQSTASDRAKFWVNGVPITTGSFSLVSQYFDTNVNTTASHRIGILQNSTGLVTTTAASMYLTEMYLLDGTQKSNPNDFGEFHTATGQWVPIQYTGGNFGTNGFYLPFSNSTSATTLGYDSSGNGHNWTPHNISLSGSTNASVVDVPTVNSADVDTGSGNEMTGNYCVWNAYSMSGGALTEGCLKFDMAGGVRVGSSFPLTEGKWYCEIDVVDTPGNREYVLGVGKTHADDPTNIFADGVAWYGANGNKYVDGSSSSYGSQIPNGSKVGIALDLDAGTVTFYLNNTSQGTITLPSTNGAWIFVAQAAASGTSAFMTANWGQRAFSYPKSGFKAVCNANLPTPTILNGNKHVNTVLYTGTNVTQSITVGFPPDLVWIKSRQSAYDNVLFDAVRGRGSGISSNSNNPGTASTTGTDFVSFDSNGFTVGPQANWSSPNNPLSNPVAWAWKANGSGSSNTDGNIASTVSVNQTAGFSIVQYVGNGSGNQSVGHGLGVTPKLVIVKMLSWIDDWYVFTTAIDGTNDFLYLNTTGAFSNATYSSPTSSVFNIGGSLNTNAYSFIAYCFAEIPNYSRISSYVGTGAAASGRFVYCGFKPEIILAKEVSVSGQEWVIYDAARDQTTYFRYMLSPTFSQAESNASQTYDVASNGFKVYTADARENRSGSRYIFAAWAISPFAVSTGR